MLNLALLVVVFALPLVDSTIAKDNFFKVDEAWLSAQQIYNVYENEEILTLKQSTLFHILSCFLSPVLGLYLDDLLLVFLPILHLSGVKA
jgi:hypothetical protein